MRGAHVPRTGVLEVRDWPDPGIERDGEVLVRMLEAAICGSDVHAVLDGNIHPDAPGVAGYPGHEGVGVVVESASAAHRPGDIVLALPPGQVGGCFAELLVVDGDHLIALPASAGHDPTELRRLLLAQQLGTCIFARKQFWPDGGACDDDVAVVLGGGSAGHFFVADLRRLGFGTVHLLERHPDRASAAGRAGALVSTTADELRTSVAGGRPPSLVVDAVGSDEVRELAIEVAGHAAHLAIFGIASEGYRRTPLDLYEAQMKCLTLHAMVGAQSEPGLASFHEATQRLTDDPTLFGDLPGPVFGLEELALAFQKSAHPMPGDGVKTFIHIADHPDRVPAVPSKELP